MLFSATNVGESIGTFMTFDAILYFQSLLLFYRQAVVLDQLAGNAHFPRSASDTARGNTVHVRTSSAGFSRALKLEVIRPERISSSLSSSS